MKARVLFAVLIAVGWTIVCNFSTAINTTLGVTQLQDSDASVITTNTLTNWQHTGSWLVALTVATLVISEVVKKETPTNEK